MKRAFSAYFRDLGATDTLRIRFATLVEGFETIVGNDVADVFVSEYLSEEVGRVFESLWIFTDDLIGEASVPEEEGDRLDLVPLRRSVRHWIVEKQDYDFKKATDASRLSMEIWLADNRVGRLRATGKNCDALMRVATARVRPNLAALASAAPRATSPSERP